MIDVTRPVKISAVYRDEPRLTEGAGFYLKPDGNWDIQEIPPNVVHEAEFSGYLTVQGYNCTVFEMPDGSMWAQKSSGTPATDDESKLATIARVIAASPGGFALRNKQ